MSEAGHLMDVGQSLCYSGLACASVSSLPSAAAW
jgi:hypothetical protein